MSRTYAALLQGDHLYWTGDSPVPADPGRSIPVTVVVPDEAAIAPGPGLATGGRDPERWQAAVAALKRLADRGTFADIADPVAWQREARKDRPLPGRED